VSTSAPRPHHPPGPCGPSRFAALVVFLTPLAVLAGLWIVAAVGLAPAPPPAPPVPPVLTMPTYTPTPTPGSGSGSVVVLARVLRPDGEPATGTAPAAPGSTAVSDGSDGSGDSDESGDWFDDAVSGAVAWFFRLVISHALNPLIGLLARTVLSTPTPRQLPVLTQMWASSRAIAVSAYGLLILFGAVIVSCYQTVQTRTSIKEIVPRIAVGFVALNMSLTVAGLATQGANALSVAVLGPGVDPAGAAAALTHALDAHSLGSAVWFLIIFMVVLVMIVAVIAGYVVRVLMLAVVLVAGPLALACHALPQTERVAAWWWRVLAALLAAQVAQALTFAVGLRLFFTPGAGPVHSIAALFGGGLPDALGSAMLVLGLLIVMFYIPWWVLTTSRIPGARLVGSLATAWAFGRVSGLLTGQGRGGGSGRGGGPGGGGPGGQPRPTRPRTPRGPRGPGRPGGPAGTGSGGPRTGPRGPRSTPGGGTGENTERPDEPITPTPGRTPPGASDPGRPRHSGGHPARPSQPTRPAPGPHRPTRPGTTPHTEPGTRPVPGWRVSRPVSARAGDRPAAPAAPAPAPGGAGPGRAEGARLVRSAGPTRARAPVTGSSATPAIPPAHRAPRRPATTRPATTAPTSTRPATRPASTRERERRAVTPTPGGPAAKPVTRPLPPVQR
jgi:hypothetical protein